jgi:hypothetical protein
MAMSPDLARTNLESTAQDTNMRIGLVALGVSLVASVLLLNAGAGAACRSLTFVPFLLAAYGIMAALFCTCGFTALAGMRRTNAGPERIADPVERSNVRARGLRVILGSVVIAAVATGLLMGAH